MEHPWVKDLKENDSVQGHYLVRTKRTALTKKGDPFLTLTLADRTGDVEARVWDNAETLANRFQEGDVIHVEGRVGTFRNQIQLILSDLRSPKGVVDPERFLESTPKDVKKMMGTLRAILRKIQNPYLKDLMDRFLNDRPFVSLFKRAPAAKNFHHNYIGGLLEHTLSVLEMTVAVTDHYPELDRDLMLAGAFLHDIGKVRELSSSPRIDYTDEGRLLGHLILAVTMIDEKLSQIKDIPQELALKLKHLVLSHHGQHEFGSPKRPKFLEAFALHLIDDLDAKVNGLGRFMERDRQEGAWTDFNRLYDRYLYKGKMPDNEKEAFDISGDDRQNVLFKPR